MHTATSVPICEVNPQMREAFDDAWLAIFETRVGDPQATGHR